MTEGNGKETTVGTVEEVLPDSLFRVRIQATEEAKTSSGSSPDEPSDGSSRGVEGPLVLAYLAGKMRLHRIRVLVGDQVDMVIDPYGGRARIVRRLT
jgi:translation initiation factor IF-1